MDDRVILGFSFRMRAALIGDSKLCAWDTRHAPACGVPPPAVAQLGKEGVSPLRCILPPFAASGGCGNRARFRTFGCGARSHVGRPCA